jgi:hypothetical protein
LERGWRRLRSPRPVGINLGLLGAACSRSAQQLTRRFHAVSPRSRVGAKETGPSRRISPSRSGVLGWPNLAGIFLSSRWNRGFEGGEGRQRGSTETRRVVADADHDIADQAVFRDITAVATSSGLSRCEYRGLPGCARRIWLGSQGRRSHSSVSRAGIGVGFAAPVIGRRRSSPFIHLSPNDFGPRPSSSPPGCERQELPHNRPWLPVGHAEERPYRNPDLA